MNLLNLVRQGVDPSFVDNLTEAIHSHMFDHAVTDKARVRGRTSHEEAANRAAKAKQSRGSLYNSHGLAAARSSHDAYRNGRSSDHAVAAQHHQHAAEAAKTARELHEPKTVPHDDYMTAEEYHLAQMKAHLAAVKHANRGNSDPHRDFTPSY
jgi:hypothetical protein